MLVATFYSAPKNSCISLSLVLIPFSLICINVYVLLVLSNGAFHISRHYTCSRCPLQSRTPGSQERIRASDGWSYLFRMQEARARGGAVLVYPFRAPTAGFPLQEEWRHVLPAGSSQESQSSRAHEPRLPLPGDGSYLSEANQRNDAEDSPCKDWT